MKLYNLIFTLFILIFINGCSDQTIYTGKIINKNLDIEYKFEALFTNISNYNDPKALYYLCGTCLFIN